MSVEIRGSSGIVANVNPEGALAVAPTLVAVDAGFITQAAESDAGTNLPRTVRALEATSDYRLRVGLDSVLFQERFTSTALNTANFYQAAVTATITVVSGFLNLNAASSVAIGAVARVQTYRTFPLWGTFPTYFEHFAMWETANNVLQIGTVVELGYGFATGVAAPTDGCVFRSDASGQFSCVVINNSGEVSVNIPTPELGIAHHYLISPTDDAVEFWINNVLVARIVSNAAVGPANSVAEQPLLARIYNTAVPSFPTRLRLAQSVVTLGDQGSTRPWEVTLAGQGRGAYQGQTGGVMGSTSNNVNSTAPALVAPTNIAAGYATLGGQFLVAAAVGAETDIILFAYLNPAGSATLPGRTLYIKGIKISTVSIGAVSGASFTALQWSLAVGSTAVSLATAEGAGTKAPRRVNVGIQTIPAAAAIGYSPNPETLQRYCPLAVEPGTYVHILLKTSAGLATASQQFRGIVSVDALNE